MTRTFTPTFFCDCPWDTPTDIDGFCLVCGSASEAEFFGEDDPAVAHICTNLASEGGFTAGACAANLDRLEIQALNRC